MSAVDAAALRLARERRALFHTDGFADSAKHGAIELSGRNPYSDAVEALSGDILMARVDRKVEDKVPLVAPISDCVYRLGSPDSMTEPVWRWLRSADGRTGLAAAVRGVSASISPRRVLTLRVG